MPPLEWGLGVSPSQAEESRADRNAATSGVVTASCRKARLRREGARGDRAEAGDRGETSGERVGLLRGLHALRHRLDPGAQIAELASQQVESGSRCLGRLLRDGEEPVDVVDTIRHHDAELGEMRADRVHGLGLLADEEVPRLVVEQRRLGPGRLHRHKPHRGRVTASQIASASDLSVFPRFTYGFT